MHAALIAPVLLLAAAADAAPGERLFAGGQWAAFRTGATCIAAARPLPPSSNEKQARAGFTFDPSSLRVGEFHVRLRRAARPGATVMLQVGDRPFLLAGSGVWAWSRGAAQDRALIDAVRTARSMRVESRDGGGRRIADRYLLDGAPTAIDAAAAGCAGKI